MCMNGRVLRKKFSISKHGRECVWGQIAGFVVTLNWVGRPLLAKAIDKKLETNEPKKRVTISESKFYSRNMGK